MEFLIYLSVFVAGAVVASIVLFCIGACRVSKHSDAIDSRERRKDALVEELISQFSEQQLGLALMHAMYLDQFGVDISKELKTAAENMDALDRAYLKGKQDAYDSFNAQQKPAIDRQPNEADTTDFAYARIPEACKQCSNHPSNGGSGICHCTLGGYSIT